VGCESVNARRPALTGDSAAWYTAVVMKRIVALACWFATATFAAGELPPVGYVDLDALLAADPTIRRADLLQDAAVVLRDFAARAPLTTPPPPPAESLPGGVGLLAGPAPEGERDAAELELALLREALAEQIARHRDHAIAEYSRDQARQLAAYDEARLLETWHWQQSLGLAQRYERINLALQLEQANLATGDAPRLQLELKVLDTLSRAAAGARERDATEARMEYARDQAQEIRDSLRHELAQEEREADRAVARRELELTDEAVRREVYRLDTLKQLGQLEVDLELAGWRQVLAGRLAAVRARRTTLQAAYRDAADALLASAEQSRAAAAKSARPRLLAWLRHLSNRTGTTLVLQPQNGIPDVTAEIAARVAALQADPATLAPRAAIEQEQ